MAEPAPSPSQHASTSPIPAHRRFFRKVNSALLRWDPVYRLYLGLKFGSERPAEIPGPRIANGVLKTRSEWQAAADNARKLQLPRHRSPEKNWDHLAAVSTILTRFPPSARILDAGAEIYSNILPTLFLYGYRELFGINLSFTDPARRGPIRYLPGDLTHTSFPDAFFDAITCMSVIEHGVPLRPYFQEMHRLLKPGGLLVTSTDYYPTPINTAGLFAHGTPIKIFTKTEIQSALSLAENIGLTSTGELDLECLYLQNQEKPIRWEPYGLEYTFVVFTLQKRI